jgi:hypothetical protein
MGDGGGMPCPVDVKECDDGSILSPDPLSCDFAECPKENIFCTQDVKECDDGSFVGRDSKNNCSFYPCKGDITREEILDQKEKWLANFNGTFDYEFTYERMCFCTQDFIRPRRVVVRDRQVASVRFADRGEGDISDGIFGATPTIEALFNEIASGAGIWYRLAVTFDPEMGYPLSIDIDEDVMLADEERNIQISNVVITAPP